MQLCLFLSLFKTTWSNQTALSWKRLCGGGLNPVTTSMNTKASLISDDGSETKSQTETVLYEFQLNISVNFGLNHVWAERQMLLLLLLLFVVVMVEKPVEAQTDRINPHVIDSAHWMLEWAVRMRRTTVVSVCVCVCVCVGWWSVWSWQRLYLPVYGRRRCVCVCVWLHASDSLETVKNPNLPQDLCLWGVWHKDSSGGCYLGNTATSVQVSMFPVSSQLLPLLRNSELPFIWRLHTEAASFPLTLVSKYVFLYVNTPGMNFYCGSPKDVSKIYFVSLCSQGYKSAPAWCMHPVKPDGNDCRCFSQTETVSAETCRWPGCCCSRASCPALCPSPCPCSHVCAYACVCACASSSSSCAHGGGDDGGDRVHHCVWRTKRWSLWKRTAPEWQAWRVWTVRLTAALYLKRERERTSVCVSPDLRNFN